MPAPCRLSTRPSRSSPDRAWRAVIKLCAFGPARAQRQSHSRALSRRTRCACGFHSGFICRLESGIENCFDPATWSWRGSEQSRSACLRVKTSSPNVRLWAVHFALISPAFSIPCSLFPVPRPALLYTPSCAPVDLEIRGRVAFVSAGNYALACRQVW